MKLIKQLSNRFYKTQLFRGLLDEYTNDPNAPVITKEKAQQIVKKQVEKVKTEQGEIIKRLSLEQEAKIPQIVAAELEKAETYRKNEAMRYRVPWNMNSNVNPDRKPLSDVPYSYLRRMAVLYPIARACINRRQTQITQLSWEITTVDEIDGEKGFETQIETVKNYLKKPMGHKSRFRELVSILIDDILTVDAVCFEITKLRGGQFDLGRGLIPVDPTTIALRVDETGAIPNPPAVAYAQYILGHKVAEFTTDEMIYEIMGARSYSPYGLAPLESLILQTEAAMRGTLYNLNYFRESNVPEGFITLPEDIAATKDIVEQWQEWFDALVAGDGRFMHRLKMLPFGATYTAAKKPEDMAFERFELWLLQQTCAVFGVPPQDIGVTYQVNKATAESQSNLSQERGLYPLANFIKEILDDIIQNLLGFDKLQFTWNNLSPVDQKLEAEIAEKEIKMGALSVDEYRITKGLEPIGLGHYILTTGGPILVKDIVAGKTAPQSNAPEGPENGGNGSKPTQEPRENEAKYEELEIEDIKKWRKCVYRDLAENKPLRKHFVTDNIRPEIAKAITEGLEEVGSKEQARVLFEAYLDPEVRASLKLLKYSRELRRVEDAISESD